MQVHGGPGALGGGDDDHLEVARSVADDIQAGDFGLSPIAGREAAFASRAATEVEGEARRLFPTEREEEGPAFERRAVGQTDALEARPLAFEGEDPAPVHGDAQLGELALLCGAQGGRPVGAQDDILRPAGQLAGQSEASAPPAVDRDRLIAVLPAVAVGTVMDARPVTLREARDLRQAVGDSRREDDPSAGEPAATLELAAGAFAPQATTRSSRISTP